jgi:hypothetical protein
LDDERRGKLVVVVETAGGYIEVVARIVDTLRHHYPRSVEFIVPNYAMSAGTVLVMSGNAIHMDYYSILGPIDPQVSRPGRPGDLIPALGYLIQYDRLIKKSQQGKLSTAELILLEKFDLAELYRYEQDRELSISLLKEWLVKYKFANWRRTASRKRAVTSAMKSRRAAQVAKKLNMTEMWHSHGRGISMTILQNDVKVLIDDFGGNEKLNTVIHEYYRLLGDYMGKRGHSGAVHTRVKYIPMLR